MKSECPNCETNREVIVHSEIKSEETLDGLGHLHLECKTCGRQFNLWNADKEEVKKVFKESYNIYK